MHFLFRTISPYRLLHVTFPYKVYHFDFLTETPIDIDVPFIFSRFGKNLSQIHVTHIEFMTAVIPLDWKLRGEGFTWNSNVSVNAIHNLLSLIHFY